MMSLPMFAQAKKTLRAWSRKVLFTDRPRRVRADPEIARVFEQVQRFRGEPPPGWIVDFLGIRTRWEFVDGLMPHTNSQVSQMWQEVPAPDVNGLEYFEWVDLMEAVRSARERFVFFELGAGYGRWAVRAAKLLQLLNPLPLKMVVVEPEPTHFEWVRQHLRDNDIEPEEHILVCAPVAASAGPVRFLVGEASTCYGQTIVADPGALEGGLEAQPMDAVALSTLLREFPRIDLIDLDIQGAEHEVLSAAITELDRRVKRLQIGTHGAQIEASLRDLFREHNWELREDFPCGSQIRLPRSGKVVSVEDGIQTWVNPRSDVR